MVVLQHLLVLFEHPIQPMAQQYPEFQQENLPFIPSTFQIDVLVALASRQSVEVFEGSSETLLFDLLVDDDLVLTGTESLLDPLYL